MVAGEKGLIRFEDVYQHAFEGAKYGRLEDEEFDVIINAIESVPKVDAVEVVHGKWGVYRENEISKTNYCTNCWKEFYIRKKGELQLDMMPYCPNCGAKMDGGGSNGI